MTNDFAYRTGELSGELQLLLSIIGSDDDRDAGDRQERFSAADWRTFVQLAKHHRLYPYLYPKLKELGDKLVPSGVLRSLHAEYCKNTFLMLALSAEMGDIGEAMASDGIDALFLKGPVLAEELYGDLSLRTSCDLDVLVRLDDLNRAEQLLCSLGYVKDDYIHSVLNDWKWRHHHASFVHPQRGIKVELHWRLHPAPSSEPDFEELWTRRRTSRIVGRPLFGLGREDLFLFLVTHGARHGWSRLRWLLDIARLTATPLDSAVLLRLLRKHRCRHIGGQALALAERLLKAPIPEPLMRLPAGKRARGLARDAMFYISRMINLHTVPVPEEVARYHKRYLFSLMTAGRRFVFLLSFLHPYPEDAETLPLPKSLHMLYFPLRPFLWAWRKTLGVPHEKRADRLL